MAAGKLTRSETDKKIAGVAGGMAAYFEWIPPWSALAGWLQG
jgi:phage shock protein PspC (stress-responsive transcriptional regulator)